MDFLTIVLFFLLCGALVYFIVWLIELLLRLQRQPKEGPPSVRAVPADALIVLALVVAALLVLLNDITLLPFQHAWSQPASVLVLALVGLFIAKRV